MADEPKVDSAAASSPAEVAPETVEDDFALPEDVKDEKSRARFQKLVDRAKAAEQSATAYKEFGEPQDIAKFALAYQQMETDLAETQSRLRALEAAREPGEPKTKEQKDLEASSKSIREQLRQHEPLLDELEKDLKARQAEREARIQSLTLDAVEATADVMKEYGMAATREKVQDMCDTLEPIIKKNPRLRFRFERNPEAAIRAAMTVYLENAKTAIEGKTRLESQRAKEKTIGLPRPHGGGGGPGTKPQEPVRSLSAGLTRGLARMQEKG